MLTRLTEAEYTSYIMDKAERILINKEQEELQEQIIFSQRRDPLTEQSVARTMPFSEAFAMRQEGNDPSWQNTTRDLPQDSLNFKF